MNTYRGSTLIRATAALLLLFVLVVGLGALPRTVAAAPTCTTDCYVDPAGNDANDGASAVTPLLTIQLAVNTVNAGGTVHLAAGTYTEDVDLNKALTLDGDGPATTIIDPVTYVEVLADDVTVTDLTIQNGGTHGVRVFKNPGFLDNTTFDNVHFKNNPQRGIEISNDTFVTDFQVLNCLFDGNTTGIRMASSAKADRLLIDNTTFQNHPNTSSGIGFYQANDGGVGYVQNLHVAGSTFTGSGFSALYMEEARDVLIETSDFSGNARGFLLFDFYNTAPITSGNIEVTNNTFTDNTAASVMVTAGGVNGLGDQVTVDLNTINQDVGVLSANWAMVDVRLQNGFVHAPVVVSDNQITLSGTYGAATATYAIKLRGGVDSAYVSGNTLDGGGVGSNGGTPPTSGIYLATNVSFYGAIEATAQVSASSNVINNFPNGVTVYDEIAAAYGGLPVGALFEVNRNDLSGNPVFGLQTAGPEMTDATCNWWGAADGPGPVGPGSGSMVTTDADFLPYLMTADLDGLCADGMYFSTTVPGVTSDSLTFGAEDIIVWDGAAWSMWFDGSAASLTPVGKWKHNINAFWIPDTAGPDVVMSFTQNARIVPGIGPKVDGMDLVTWDGSAFSLYFDGSDVGLTNKTQEKIDGLHILDGSMSPIGGSCQAYLLVSTQGPGRVPNFGGGTLKFSGEDVLGFCLTNSGANTAGFWTMVLDGSAQGMPKNSTDSISFSADGQTMFLTTRGAFNVDSASGGNSMVYTYDFGTQLFSGPIFDAPAYGLPETVDGLQVAGTLP